MKEATARELSRLRADLEEARMWARHGYEIGQRSCTWTDYGIAPAWLTDDPICLCHHPKSSHTDRCQGCIAIGMDILTCHRFLD